MKRSRISIAKLMAAIAVIAVGLVFIRPPRLRPSITGGVTPAEAYVSQGTSALAGGRWAEARSRYETALKRNPNACEGYAGLGQLAYAQEQFAEAYRLWSQAIDVASSTAGAGDKVPGLYRMRATASVALSRLEGPDAVERCQAALSDLAKGNAGAVEPSFMMLSAEIAAGEMEQRLGKFAERYGDYDGARDHYTNAATHAKKALVIEPKNTQAAALLEEVQPRRAEQ